MSAEKTTNPLFVKKVRWNEFFIEKAILVTSFFSIAGIVLIFIFVFREAIPIFIPQGKEKSVESLGEMETYGEEINPESVATAPEQQHMQEEVASTRPLWSQLFGLQWQPVSREPKFGLIPLVLGSIKVAFLAILFAAPLGILAALYSTMFAPRWIREILKPLVEVLAGFPSVVIGFFVLVVLASAVQSIFGFTYRLNSFVGGIALAIAVVPVIFTISEDALSAVPRSLIDASLALGSRTWETAIYIVLPAAIPGIFASVLLGMGRAIGETMIALMVTGNAALLDLNIATPARTMAATIGAEMAEVVFGDVHYTVLFALGVVLFVFSFTINSTVEIFIRQRLMKRFAGV